MIEEMSIEELEQFIVQVQGTIAQARDFLRKHRGDRTVTLLRQGSCEDLREAQARLASLRSAQEAA